MVSEDIFYGYIEMQKVTHPLSSAAQHATLMGQSLHSGCAGNKALGGLQLEYKKLQLEEDRKVGLILL